MTKLYFDVSDIVHFASRYNRVTGIQRVQLNIITLLAHKYGGEVVRCAYFDRAKKAMFEFDLSKRPADFEFDAERFLVDIGLLRPSTVFPSKVQVKSYLRQYNNNKPLRTWKKVGVYLTALFVPGRLARKGISLPSKRLRQSTEVSVSKLTSLPAGSTYVSLGALWFTPEVWAFAQAHRDHGGDVVQMVYDLIPILHPEYYSPTEPPAFTAWLNSALSYASRFVCISKATAADLKHYANKHNSDPTMKAIPLAHEFMGYPRAASIATPPALAHLNGKRYVLCVGTIEARKNGLALLEIWKQFSEAPSIDLPMLVFAGKYGKGGAEFQEYLASNQRLSKFVEIAYSPSDHDLAWLYKNCLFSVYASKIEGWGLPVGESVWFGRFCVTSKTTSMPEVCGGLVDYLDPYDVIDMKAMLLRPIIDPTYVQQREQRIAETKLRQWSDVADEIYDFVMSSDRSS